MVGFQDDTAVATPKLPAGKKYHTFLSHAWASAQADARAMKMSLVYLLRDLRVFLDVHRDAAKRCPPFCAHTPC